MLRHTFSGKRFLGIRPELGIGLFLAIAALMVYGQVAYFEYVNLDDSVYVFDNPYVRKGLTSDGFAWAFQFKDRDFSTYWHPLTWLSHMLDASLFGLNPGWHHIVNLCFHVFSSLLLLGVLHRMTGALWKSAFVAALFAIHPLNVESVAWVAERKNVLSSFFWMLTLISYIHYVARPVMSRYLLTVWVFILGLMAKPMLVTLPIVMLLLDYWPLKRFESRLPGNAMNSRPEKSGPAGIAQHIVIRAVMEKIPLLLFSAAAIYLSSSSAKSLKTMVTVELVPMKLRIANALITYVKYMLKMIWPLNLSVFYPYPKSIPVLQIVGALIMLAGISFGIVRLARNRPYLGVGWFWYLGTLVPVIGLVQTGLWPEMADRWAYIPLIGIFIIIAWGVPDALQKWRYRQISLVIISIPIIILLMSLARQQTGYWQNSFKLFGRAVRVDKNNVYARMMLGNTLQEKKRTTEALQQFNEVLQIDPTHYEAYNHIGIILAGQGKLSEAIIQFNKALQLNPYDAIIHFNLGKTLFDQGNYRDAASEYAEAIRLKPEFIEAHNNMGMALARQGNIKAAIQVYTEALKFDPDDPKIRENLKNLLSVRKSNDAVLRKLLGDLNKHPQDYKLHYKIGNIYKNRGNRLKAIQHYQTALSIKPDFIEVRLNLGLIYALQGDYNAARSAFQRAVAIRPGDWRAYYYTAGTYAKQNNIEKAIEWLEKSIDKDFKDWNMLRTDLNFQNIRDTSYFKKIVQRH